MAPRLVEKYDIEQVEEGRHGAYYHQQQQQQQDGEWSSFSDILPALNFDAYYGANRRPPSPRPSKLDFEMFKTRRETRHRRTDSRNRSLWHRASRRLLSAAESSFGKQKQQSKQQQLAPEPRVRSSRKHNSLMMDDSSSSSSSPTPTPQQQQQHWQHHQQQLAQRRHQTWYYSSNHVLVNKERLAHGLSPMMRSIVLDDKARAIAQWAAEGKELKDAINDKDARTFSSGNVLVGGSIREIHGQMLVRETCQRERGNLLNPEYREFGMGTYKEPESGLLYMCQLFGTGRQ